MLSGEFFLQTSLLSAMLGASIGFCIQEGFTDPSTFRIIAIVALILHLVNFYHAKVGRLYDRTEQLSASGRPYVRVSIILTNVLLFSTFCVMALRIATVAAITLGEVMIRVIDIITVAAQLRVGDRSPGRAAIDPTFARQLRYWQYMNAITLLVFSSVFVASLFVSYAVAYPVAVSFLTILVAIDLVIEYGVFAKNYFQGLDDWNRLAERWDQLQGEIGDQFRVSVINPFVLAWANEHLGVRDDSVIIDAGCGNGCMSRVLAGDGYRTIAFDKAERLVEIGKLYRRMGTEYIVADVDDKESLAQVEQATQKLGARRRAAIALFSLQDCDELQPAFRDLAAMLRVGERLLVVYETEASFRPTGSHASTARTWKYSRSGERKQIVSWLPVTNPNPTSVCAKMVDDPNLLIATVTNFRTLDDYVSAAGASGLVKAAAGILSFDGPPTTIAELQYAEEPKFAFVEFRRVEQVPAQRSAEKRLTVATESTTE